MPPPSGACGPQRLWTPARRWRRAGEGQREADTPQQASQRDARATGPDTRSRTSTPAGSCWGDRRRERRVCSARAVPRLPVGWRGKLVPIGQRAEGHQTVARGRGATQPTRGHAQLACRDSGTIPSVALPESRVAILTCMGRQMRAPPLAPDEARPSPDLAPGVAPLHHRTGCHLGHHRHADPPKQRCAESVKWCATCARCASRPFFAV